MIKLISSILLLFFLIQSSYATWTTTDDYMSILNPIKYLQPDGDYTTGSKHIKIWSTELKAGDLGIKKHIYHNDDLLKLK